MNKANSHKSRALGTISHKIYTKFSEMYFEPLLYLKTVKTVRKSNKKRSDYGQTDRQTDRPT